MSETRLSIVAQLRAEGFTAGIRKMQRSLNNFSRSAKQIGGGLSRTITGPVVLALGAATKVAVDFEKAMAGVQAVSGFAAADMGKLTAAAQELGRTTQLTASEAAGLQTELAKLGFDPDQILAMQDATASLAIAFGVDLSDAAARVGSTLRVFNLEAEESAHVADVMATAFGSTALDSENLAEGLAKAGPIANSLGISLEQTTAILGQLANNGIAGSVAGTGLAKVFIELAKEGGDVKQNLSELLNGSISVTEAVERFGDRAGKIVPIIAGAGKEVDALTESFKDSDGAASEARKVLEDTAKGALDKMRSALEATGIALSGILLPAVRALAERIISITEYFQSLSTEQQNMIAKVALVAAAIGPLILILGSLASGMSAIIGLASTMGISMTAMLGPIGALAALIVGSLAYSWNKAAREAKEYQQYQDELREGTEDLAPGVADAVVEVRRMEKALEELGEKGRVHGFHGWADGILNETDIRRIFKGSEEAISDFLEAADYTAPLRGMADRQRSILNGMLLIAKARVEEAKTAAEAEAAQNALNDAYDRAVQNLETLETKQEVLAETDKQSQGEIIGYLQTRVSALQEVITAGRLAGENTATYERLLSEARAELDGLTASTETLNERNKDLFETINDGYRRLADEERLSGQNSSLEDRARAAQSAYNAALELKRELEEGTSDDVKDLSERERTAALSEVNRIIDEQILKYQELQEGIAAAADLEVLMEKAKENADAQRAKELEKQKQLQDLVTQGAQNTVNAIFAAVQGTQSLGDALKQVFIGLVKQVVQLAIANALASAFSPADPANAATGGLKGAATAPVMVGSILSTLSSIPAFAEGGAVTSSTLALIGEKPGSRGEAVIPFEKIGDFVGQVLPEGFGANNVVVTGRIKGNDIAISNTRGGRGRGRAF